ncbi:hypothetical protein VQ7734_00320 [Vibrio quintilis]|uniref:Uncharacterized protein n=1 Tax=Vibrio quintilis TaxID=1117707 RepID=A0A1M7YQ22_9VIBR|nr:hypothetical protein VQ7734_00320 [Vibrio quintilis]
MLRNISVDSYCICKMKIKLHDAILYELLCYEFVQNKYKIFFIQSLILILKVGTLTALYQVTLLSRGSPSQLTLLVNLIIVHTDYQPVTHSFVTGFFLSVGFLSPAILCWLTGNSLAYGDRHLRGNKSVVLPL